MPAADHGLLVSQFTAALMSGDISQVVNLLHDDGEFNAQDEQLNVIELPKQKYLQWLSKKFKNEIDAISWNTCVSCLVGEEVVLVNHGLWPRIPKDPSEREKAGLAFLCRDGFIKEIGFCYVMLAGDNPFVVERKGSNVRLLQSFGIDEELAIRMVFGSTEGCKEPEITQGNSDTWLESLLIHPSHNEKDRQKYLALLRQIKVEHGYYLEEEAQSQKEQFFGYLLHRLSNNLL